jgi:hypothetical protein
LKSNVAHLLNCPERRRKAILNCLEESLSVADWHKPAVLAIAHELRYSGNERTYDGTSQRHRFHNHRGKSLGKAWQDKSSRAPEMVSYIIAVDPPGDLNAILFGAEFSISGQSQAGVNSTWLEKLKGIDSSKCPFCSQRRPTHKKLRQSEAGFATSAKYWGSNPQCTTCIFGQCLLFH